MKLNYKVYGEEHSEVILILHGLFGMLDNWTTLSKQFAKNYKVYAIDQRNHGKSFHDSEMNYKAMAADLNEFMDEHNIYTTNLIGHSMGGKTVMAFANFFPERVERLIVVDIAPKAYAPKHNEIIDALTDLPINGVKTRNEADDWLKTRIDEFGIRQFLLKNLSRSKSGFEWKMNLPIIVKHYDSIIGDVDITNGFERPTLMLYGGKSNYLNEDDKENIDLHYDNVKFVEIEGAGHWVHAERPQEFFDQVSRFLETPLY